MIYFYTNTYNRVAAVSFQFTHVGRDPGVARLWMGLDEDPDVGKFIGVFGLEHRLEDKWTVVCYNPLFLKLTDLRRELY